MIAWFQANMTLILGVLFCLSEALSYIPSVKANGVFQMIFGWISQAHTATAPAPVAAPKV